MGWDDFVETLRDDYGAACESLNTPLFDDPQIPADIRVVARIVFPEPRRWFDTPVPVLGHRNPREALKSASGLREVQQLLRELTDFFIMVHRKNAG